ncbi:NADPH-adrenodoxin reductase [Ascoidea rubescens DSM 1968]|uniref:NADPH:adrenodoxin oxidoreductase, mitochondrial n=1 Tax=Ascoidea rubescens DSM 1968 TaxID=1344418 RepID=A0A1D2V9U8_9ASCO|nr:nucleotide-binding domain-containing protein [Ascoidea rubescens DSM 1968]ODV58436.1 nucleotide-binding domain-containing protein [Ascoidea rubescens DSM 1968]
MLRCACVPSRVFHRLFSISSSVPVCHVAIVGAGPAGFYAALRLAKKQSSLSFKIKITIFEKLPVPFGLARYGVAPDHPEVKNCQDTFTALMDESPASPEDSIKFFGNVNIGNDISISNLINSYNAIFFAYGSAAERNLDIPGADHPAVISSKKFVEWYNSYPSSSTSNQENSPFSSFSLKDVQNVTIVGNGNVALDIARVLLLPPSYWEKTDISPKALSILKESSVKRVNIIARRGLIESKFSNKELRELLQLSYNKKNLTSNIKFLPLNNNYIKSLTPFVSQMSRAIQRRFQLIENFNVFPFPENVHFQREWNLDFLKSPIKINKNPQNENLLESTDFAVNKLLEASPIFKKTKLFQTDEIVNVKNDLLISSIGYKGIPLPSCKQNDLSFNNEFFLNIDGRIKQSDGTVKPGLYCLGWIKNNSNGAIASTMIDSFNVADSMISDYFINSKTLPIIKLGDEGIKHSLKNINYTTWDNWKKIDRIEKQKGKQIGVERVKFDNVHQMLKSINKL